MLCRHCQTTIDGEPTPFTIFLAAKFPTKGGYMFDIKVTCQVGSIESHQRPASRSVHVC